MENYAIEQNSSDELQHWGIKGMKWGVRRYQNKDGTLTDAGMKRYAYEADNKGYKDYDSDTGTYYKKSKKGNRDDLKFDASRYAKEDNERLKRVAEDSSRLSNELKKVNDKAIKNTPKTRLDLSDMTDKELRDQINRELLERQYNDVFNPPQISKGREFASKALEVAGDTLAVTGSALAVALSIQALRKGMG